MLRIIFILVVCGGHLTNAIVCHSCFDVDILQYKHLIPEMNFVQLSKLPSCSSPATKQCWVGCYESKLERSSTSTAYIRSCATDRVISQMRPGGSNKLPQKREDSVTVSAYMCTQDKCNDKFGKETFLRLPSYWMIFIGLIVFIIILFVVFQVLRCKRQKNPQHNQYSAVSVS